MYSKAFYKLTYDGLNSRFLSTLFGAYLGIDMQDFDIITFFVLMATAICMAITYETVLGIRNGTLQGRKLRKTAVPLLGSLLVICVTMSLSSAKMHFPPTFRSTIILCTSIAALILLAFLWDRYWRPDNEED